ncbi:MAG TPA: hypothetical protein DEG69_03160 [Flavobacteriaceae bacterium]|nr:hypothetical protein [Flavobacteriaceae bacterium]
MDKGKLGVLRLLVEMAGERLRDQRFGALPRDASEARPAKILDPAGLSEIRMPDYPENIDYDLTPVDPSKVAPKRIINISDLQGDVLIPAFGDRTNIGALSRIGPYKLSSPVDLQGGNQFMRFLDTGIWASDRDKINPIARKAQAISEEGKTPKIIYTAMAGGASDFSTMMSDVTLDVISQSKIFKKDAKEFDKIIKKEVDKDWVGILDPKARDYMADKMIGTDRAKVFKQMDKTKWVEKGFPHIGVIRAAITDPDLLTTRALSSGRSIGDIDVSGQINPSRHRTYPYEVQGQYLGGLRFDVPNELIFRNFYKSREGKDRSSDQRAFLLQPYIKQEVDQQMVDEVSRFIELMRQKE